MLNNRFGAVDCCQCGDIVQRCIAVKTCVTRGGQKGLISCCERHGLECVANCSCYDEVVKRSKLIHLCTWHGRGSETVLLKGLVPYFMTPAAAT